MSAAPEFDAIVVGSGAAGGWAAKELTERGLTVLLLEAGRSIEPERDYALPAPAESRLAARLTTGLIRQPIQMRCAVYNARTRHFFVDDRANPYTTPTGKPFNWFRGRQVGGRLHVWGRVVARLSDLELKAASRDGYGVDWPLAYEDLAPYYDHVERFLGVDGGTDGIATVPDSTCLGPYPMTAEEIDFKSKVEAAFSDRRVIGARVVRHERERIPATIRAAQRTGRLTLRSDAVVQRIIVDTQTGSARGVGFVDRLTKQPHDASAGRIVLCASAIESVRVLLNSAGPRHPAGLGNSSGRLGHGVMDHIMIALAGPAPLDAGEWCADPEADPYDYGRAAGFYVPRFRNIAGRGAPFRRGYTVQGGIGRGPGWYLLAHGEMLARLGNRITLERDRRDAWGIPIARIACTLSDNERRMIEDAAAAMRAMADAAGLTIRMPPSGKLLDTLAFKAWRPRLLDRSGAFLPGSAVHEIGGAAMGDDPATSVVNRFGQLWDAPNVVVADGACFPSGCSQNITLTIMALAVRAAHHVAAKSAT